MRDHVLIGKFIGIWPTKRALRSWISTKWNPKGHITLHLGPKGFFTAVFNCLEDRNRIMDGGPYFFNSAGLFLKGWVERFNPDKEDLSYAPVWIRLHSLLWNIGKKNPFTTLGIRWASLSRLQRKQNYADTRLMSGSAFIWI